MSKAFTKGEKATLVGSWDNKGTFYFQQVIVHSCGAKQMVLTDESTGEEIGRHFEPAIADAAGLGYFNWQGTFKRLTDEQAQALCLQLGAALPGLIDAENARREAWNAQQGRVCLGRVERELHEPRAMKREARA